ncbi:Zinc finger, C6HC-type [Penicillium roqueforti FM164]|uniref:RBR-type E3 ubiquitin transferase n=1 Tax=Penicillium roqueforti (strain FM164) TaxID=1365484 RepID=W6QJX5_PENRF|nr:Zinc finger, C6HC-type [Penicillium roqueforti FM164]
MTQLGELMSKIRGRIFTRGAALSLDKELEQKASSNPKMQGKMSAVPGEYVISDDSDEDLLDEGLDDQYECTCCTEKYPQSDIIQTECAHTYCRECIVRLFENALANEASFPPRCCRLPIAVSITVEDMIGIEIMKRYKERNTEVNDCHRTYCSNSPCSRYIPPQNIRRGVGICQSCAARTCADCKRQGHRGNCNHQNTEKCKRASKAKKRKRVSKVKKRKRASNAKERKSASNEKAKQAYDDEMNDNLLERLANRKKWKRCSNCSRMIEHIDGCMHISCLCGWEFCYVCGEKWRNCRHW